MLERSPVKYRGAEPISATRQDAAESLAIDKISEETCQAIAGDVEYRLNLIIQEAHKFMRHAKRTTMMPEDIDYALQALNVQVSVERDYK